MDHSFIFCHVLSYLFIYIIPDIIPEELNDSRSDSESRDLSEFARPSMRPDSRDGKAEIEGQGKREKELGGGCHGKTGSAYGSGSRQLGVRDARGGARYREYAVRGIGRPFPSK